MSATTVGLAVLVDGPLPSAPEFNLLTVAQDVRTVGADGAGDLRWLNGITVRGYPNQIGDGVEPCLLGTLAYKEGEDTTERPLQPSFQPVTAYVGENCTARSIWNWEDFQDRANRVTNAVLHHHAERELVSGQYTQSNAQNPYLGDINVLPAGAALNDVFGPTEALALLEDAIGATGRQGVIHATPGTITAWSALSLLVVVQGQLRTFGGTPVVRGTGYIGKKPLAGAAPGADQAWAWASGPVLYATTPIVRLPADIAEALDRVSNDVVYRAERDFVVAWDTALQVAVLVDRSA